METSVLAYPGMLTGTTEQHMEQPGNDLPAFLDERLTFLNSWASRPERTTHEH